MEAFHKGDNERGSQLGDDEITFTTKNRYKVARLGVTISITA